MKERWGATSEAVKIVDTKVMKGWSWLVLEGMVGDEPPERKPGDLPGWFPLGNLVKEGG